MRSTDVTGADCRCKIVNDGGRMHLPPENMVDDCPLHGTAARERLEAVAQDRGPFMLTSRGNRFYPLDPRPSEIHIEDIAHHLALTCRFGGATRFFYSVAQHSVYVSEQIAAHHLRKDHATIDELELLTEEAIVECMHGLLHDASEAYLGDIISPIKCLPGMRDYRLAERVVEMCVGVAFGLPEDKSKLLELVDARMLLTEGRDLLVGELPPANVEPYEFEISPAGPMAAEAGFMRWFVGLTKALKFRKEIGPAPTIKPVLATGHVLVEGSRVFRRSKDLFGRLLDIDEVDKGYVKWEWPVAAAAEPEWVPLAELEPAAGLNPDGTRDY